MLEVVNPATGEVVDSHDEMEPDEVSEAIGLAGEAHLAWRDLDFSERAEPMRRVAELLRDEADRLAGLMAVEMGKPLAAGRSEVEKCAWVCDYYAEHAEAFLSPEPVDTEARRSLVAFRPLGVVLAVMPWNFPLWQVFRFAAPGLMAGNAGVLKHASNVPGCALAIEGLFRSAGFPEHLFRTLLIGSSRVEAVIQDPRIAAVTLTGSTGAGRSVGAQAGKALKKSVLELGGSDPYVILEDADLEAAAEACATSRLINAGQSCIAAKRFVVVEEVAERFEELFVEAMSSRVMGSPLEETTDIGPQARHDLRDQVHEQVVATVERGARRLLGGEVPDHPGAFYPATVLADVPSGTPAYDDEIFGPVGAVIPVADEDEAVEVANDSPFGLGAAVFTADLERGERIATQDLQAGCCFVNAFVRSDPRLPFGGVKESGYGRELAEFGIREFVNIKTVWVD